MDDSSRLVVTATKSRPASARGVMLPSRSKAQPKGLLVEPGTSPMLHTNAATTAAAPESSAQALHLAEGKAEEPSLVAGLMFTGKRKARSFPHLAVPLHFPQSADGSMGELLVLLQSKRGAREGDDLSPSKPVVEEEETGRGRRQKTASWKAAIPPVVRRRRRQDSLAVSNGFLHAEDELTLSPGSSKRRRTTIGRPQNGAAPGAFNFSLCYYSEPLMQAPRMRSRQSVRILKCDRHISSAPLVS